MEAVPKWVSPVTQGVPRAARGGSGSATHPPCPCVQAVAVHCMLGHGRTGTLLACYLCKERHLAGGDAIREIRRLRPGSIETAEQEQAVIRFCQCLRWVPPSPGSPVTVGVASPSCGSQMSPVLAHHWHLPLHRAG